MLAFGKSSSSALADSLWIDLVNPSDEERAQVEAATHLTLPTQETIQEIESSSRAYAEGGALYLSSPVLESSDCVHGQVVNVGFVLSPTRLITLRFGEVAAFATVAGIFAKAPPRRANDVFLKLVETIVDHAADALEHASAELEQVS